MMLSDFRERVYIHCGLYFGSIKSKKMICHTNEPRNRVQSVRNKTAEQGMYDLKKRSSPPPMRIYLCDGVSRARMAFDDVNFDNEEGDIPEIFHESKTPEFDGIFPV